MNSIIGLVCKILFRMLVVLLVFVIFVEQIVCVQFPFTQYTHVASAFDGTPCLTGCSAVNDCVINWKWEKLNCRSFDVAPIYSTAQSRDPERKYCLSNCGYFGEKYEWCITTEDLQWDYCSSYDSSTFHPSGEHVAKTLNGVWCTDKCGKSQETAYYWCHCLNEKREQSWNYCAPPTLPRIPVLLDHYDIGSKLKGKCNSFLKYTSNYLIPSRATTFFDARDNFVTGLADAIEKTGKHNSVTHTMKISDAGTSIESVTIVKMGEFAVPAVVRAHVTREHTQKNESEVSEEVRKKIREQMVGNTNSFKAGHLIGAELGGSSAAYNIVPRASCWTTDDWWEMEQAVKRWCIYTEGSVDMLVVVLYANKTTPVPKAFGVSLAFRNPDNSLFVDCSDVIHGNFF